MSEGKLSEMRVIGSSGNLLRTIIVIGLLGLGIVLPLLLSVQYRVFVLGKVYGLKVRTVQLYVLEQIKRDLPASRGFLISAYMSNSDSGDFELEEEIGIALELALEGEGAAAQAAEIVIREPRFSTRRLGELDLKSEEIQRFCVEQLEGASSLNRLELLGFVSSHLDREASYCWLDYEPNGAMTRLRSLVKAQCESIWRSEQVGRDTEQLLWLVIAWQLRFKDHESMPPSLSLIVESFEEEWSRLVSEGRISADLVGAPLAVASDFSFINYRGILSGDSIRMVLENKRNDSVRRCASPAIAQTVSDWESPTVVCDNEDFIQSCWNVARFLSKQQREHIRQSLTQLGRLEERRRINVAEHKLKQVRDLQLFIDCLNDLDSGDAKAFVRRLCQMSENLINESRLFGAAFERTSMDSSFLTKFCHELVRAVSENRLDEFSAASIFEALNNLSGGLEQTFRIFDSFWTPECVEYEEFEGMLDSLGEPLFSDSALCKIWLSVSPELEVRSHINSQLTSACDCRAFLEDPAIFKLLSDPNRLKLRKRKACWDEIEQSRVKICKEFVDTAPLAIAVQCRDQLGLKFNFEDKRVLELRRKLNNEIGTLKSGFQQFNRRLRLLIRANWAQGLDFIESHKGHRAFLSNTNWSIYECFRLLIDLCPDSKESVVSILNLAQSDLISLSTLRGLKHQREVVVNWLRHTRFPKQKTDRKCSLFRLGSPLEGNSLSKGDATIYLLNGAMNEKNYPKFKPFLKEYFNSLDPKEWTEQYKLLRICEPHFLENPARRKQVYMTFLDGHAPASDIPSELRSIFRKRPELIAEFYDLVRRDERKSAKIAAYNLIAFLGTSAMPLLPSLIEQFRASCHKTVDLEVFAALVYAIVHVDRRGEKALEPLTFACSKDELSDSARRIILCSLRRFDAHIDIEERLSRLKKTMPHRFSPFVDRCHHLVQWRRSFLLLDVPK